MKARQNLYLIGLMGSGKTTIGRQLARYLEYPFLDSDHEIVARTGVNVSTIFEIEGEAGFRSREARMIEELTQKQGVVLATGGGAVMDQTNRETLRSRGWVAYLNVVPELLLERLRYDRGRPLLRVEDPLIKLKSLHLSRDPLYRETAHFIVDAGGLPTSTILQLLLKEFRQQCAN